MFILIKNVELYNPIYQGKQDILICNDKIIKINPNIVFEDAEVIDKSGFIAIPGIIDQHIHITGGGGEGGFHTRTPEVKLTDLIKGGVTTVVGLLGTDSLTQGVETLLAKAKALKTEGITAYCLTGAYSYPSPNITGSVEKDITFIDEIIGVKLAISDHREPMITTDELKKLASVVRVASMIGSKVGNITLHMGDDKKGLQPVYDILKETSLPIKHFRPTHINRNQTLFTDGLKFLSMGGYIDLTVGRAFKQLKADLIKLQVENLPLNHVTFSSDGNGSWSNYDEFGHLKEIGISSCDGILKSMEYLIHQGESIESIIQFGTSNVANALNLVNKGFIEVNKDADILILDKQFNLDTLLALGQIMMKDKHIIKKGTYEI